MFRSRMKHIAFGLLATMAPLSARAQVPPPIFDFHMHAQAPSSFGGAQSICANNSNVSFPGVDPQERATPQNAAICDDPIMSAQDEADNIRRTADIMKRRNIYGLLDPVKASPGDTFETFERWRAAAPGRYRMGFDFYGAGLPPLEDVRQWIEEGRIDVFFEISVQYEGLKPDDPQLLPYYALAEELDIPVAIHMGEGPPGGNQVMLGSPYQVALGDPLLLEPILRAFPKLRVVAVHAGSPFVDEMIAMLYSYPQLYIDVAQNNWGFPKHQFHRWLHRFVEAGFAKRILFGSDQMIWPDTMEIAIERIDDAPFLSEAQKRDILYNNAARFLRFSDAEIDRHHRGE
ncbi:MAG: amidohydrolase family protein [Pseudomonadota bacterium]